MYILFEKDPVSNNTKISILEPVLFGSIPVYGQCKHDQCAARAGRYNEHIKNTETI